MAPKTLPKNCFLFETCSPGSTVGFEIDSYLWPMCNYEIREQFLATLAQQRNPSNNLTLYQEAIRSLHITHPASTYYPRTLTVECGRGARKTLQGIYKFTHKTPFTETPASGSGHSIYKNIMSYMIEEDGFTATNSIIEHICINDPDAVDGAIFMLVSCGSLVTNTENTEKIATALVDRYTIFEPDFFYTRDEHLYFIESS